MNEASDVEQESKDGAHEVRNQQISGASRGRKILQAAASEIFVTDSYWTDTDYDFKNNRHLPVILKR